MSERHKVIGCDKNARRRFLSMEIRSVEAHNKAVEVRHMWKEIEKLRKNEQLNINKVSLSKCSAYPSKSKPPRCSRESTRRSDSTSMAKAVCRSASSSSRSKVNLAQEQDSWEHVRRQERKRKAALQQQILTSEEADACWRPDLYYTQIKGEVRFWKLHYKFSWALSFKACLMPVYILNMCTVLPLPSCDGRVEKNTCGSQGP